MDTKIFINLPVKELERTVSFFTKLDFKFNAQMTDENATCMIVSDSIFVMLLMEEFFKGFTKKEICDTTKSAEVILSLSVNSKDEVNAFVEKAVAAGAKTPVGAMDHGFMYQWGFQDLDGHMWEVFWMDPNAMQ